MAVIQPIAQSIPAFDAKNSNTFTFVSNGGNQVVANRLVIRNNDTNEEVYNKKIESYRFEHIVEGNTLVNGTYYNFYFITYDINDNESPISNIVPFMCYDTPTVNITNIPIDGIVDSSTFVLDIYYNQIQGELIDFAKVILLDTFGNQIFVSDNLYNTEIPPLELSYTLNGLENNVTYGIMVEVITINGTVVDSEVYNFTTQYFSPSFSTLLELENNCEDGYVQIKNNFYIVDADSNPPNIGENPNYIKDGKAYLTEDGTYINWNQGYTIKGDFTLRIFAENPKMEDICTLKDGNKKIEICFIEDYDENYNNEKRVCLELKCYDFISQPYYIYSNFIDNTEKVFIWIRRKNNLFEIKLEEII